VISSALPRVMGSHLTAKGCAANSQGLVSAFQAGSPINGEALRGRIEDYYIPVAPVLTPQETLERPGRILRVDAEGRVTDFHVFSDAPSNYSTGFFSVTKLEGREVLVPRGLVLAVARGPGGALYASNNITGQILRFDANGTPSLFATIPEGVLALHHDTRADALLAVTSPVEEPDAVKVPRILRFTADGQQSELAVLPGSYNYLTGFSRGVSGGRYIPVGYMIDITQDAQGQLYAVLNLGSAVLRLNADGSWEEFARDIRGGSGITVADDGHVFVASAPFFDINNEDTLVQGLRVTAISPEKQATVLYESSATEPYKTGFFTGFGDGEGYYPLDAIFNLHLDTGGNLYLEDNLANTLTLLPRQ
jgi:hypothetical protein